MDLPDDAPCHAHIYFSSEQRSDAEALRSDFESEPDVLFVGRMTSGKAGPHPIPQYEVHFLRKSIDRVREMIRAAGLRGLVHPLTDNDLEDHTSLGEWIGGEPLELDLTVLDPPGVNQGLPRFGKTDF
jgi:aromatic ring-cleaving dioxygenase